MHMKEQQGWVAAQEEVSQEQKVGNKKHSDSDFSKKGHCPTTPK